MDDARMTAKGARPAGRDVAKACGWLMWGAALLLAPALVQAADPYAGGLDPQYYLWTTAIPASLVVAAVCLALRARLVTWRRRALAVGLAVALAYLGLWAARQMCQALVDDYWGVLRIMSWPERALRWASWCTWGACLALWVVPAPHDEPSVSPLAGRSGVEALTQRERDVAEALVAGESLATVASRLGISPSTAGTYRTRACEKLGVDSLDELVPIREEPPAPDLDVTSRAARPLVVVMLCLGVCARLLVPAQVIGAPAYRQLVVVLVTAVVLAAPFVVAWGYARVQGMWIRRMRLSGRLALVLATLFLLGFLAGGAHGNEVRVPGGAINFATFAYPVMCVALAWLVPYLLDPGLDEPLALDERRCLLYLRGRGAGELQAKVLVRIARGECAPDICEALSVARGTVKAYRAQGYELLGVHTRSELAALLARDTGVRPSADKNKPFAEVEETSD